MIKQLLIGLALALLAPAAPAFAQSAADIVGPMQEMVGKEYSGGLKVVSVTAEGNILVFTIDGQQGWSVGSKEATQAFMAPFCADEAGVEFLKSNYIRLDRLDHGANLEKGEATNTCAAPAK